MVGGIIVIVTGIVALAYGSEPRLLARR